MLTRSWRLVGRSVGSWRWQGSPGRFMDGLGASGAV